jgi:ankyrin repeat protein
MGAFGSLIIRTDFEQNQAAFNLESVPGASELVERSAMVASRNRVFQPNVFEHAVQFHGPFYGSVNFSKIRFQYVIDFEYLYTRVVVGMDPTDLKKSTRDQEKEIEEELYDMTTNDDLAEPNSSIPSPLEGTCTWILDDPLYQEWLRDDAAGGSCALRIRSPAGFGKTVMTKYLLEHLHGSSPSPSTTSLTLSFFCMFDRLRPVYQIVKALLAQLIRAQPNLIKHLSRDFYFYKETGGLFSTTNRDILWMNFESALSNTEANVIHIIIDGLDCYDAASITWISGNLRGLISRPTGPKMKLLISSRHLGTLQEGILESFPVIEFLSTTRREAIDHDLQLYASHIVNERIVDNGDARLRQELSRKLAQKAENMFLWVKLALNELEHIKSTSMDPDLVHKAVSEIPSGLDALYGRMLSRLDTSQRDRAASILAWVNLASRPLRMSELLCAIDMDGSNQRAAMDTMNSITAAAGNLIVVRDQTIHLAHYSVREFLLTNNRETHPELVSFAMAPEVAHHMIAKTLYQSICDGHSEQIGYEFAIPASDSSPLLEYASRHWVEHLHLATADVADIFEPDDTFCIPHSMVRYRWLKQHLSTEMRGLDNPEDFTMTHFAAFFGLAPLLSKWLNLDETKTQDHIPSNASDSIMQPLHWACRNGHYDCVKLLLDHGANIHLKGRGITPIVWAVRNGHSSIVRLLIKYKVGLEVVDRGLTPLGWAAWDGRHDVAAVLLEGGARANSKRLSTFLAVPWENSARHLRNTTTRDAELLLITESTMIEANFVSNYWTSIYPTLAAYTASLCASYVAGELWKLVSEARFLHCSGDSLPGQDYGIYSQYLTPSRYSTSQRGYFWGHYQDVLFILRPELWKKFCGLLYVGLVNTICLKTSRLISRIDMKILAISTAILGPIITSLISTSLSTARNLSAALNFNTVNILLVYARDRSWQAGATIIALALLFSIDASFEARFDLFPAVLALGSFSAGGEHKFAASLTPLNLAASRGHARVVELLLQHGAKTSQGSKDTNTAIYLAAKYVHHPTLGALLEHCGSRESRLDDKPSTLQLAALCSRIDIVTQLIERGADINERSPRGFCALHTTAFAGHVDVTRYLLSKGADINALSRDGISPLFAAVCRGHGSVIQTLLERGADVQHATVYGITPLHIAVWLKNSHIIQLLLDAKASLTSQDMQGLTPLDYAAEGIRVNTWSTTSTSLGLQSDPNATALRSMRELAEEIRYSSLDHRRFEQLGYYLLRIGDTEKAAQAYRWARGPSQSLPWYFCQECANSSSTDGVWICTTCYITIAQPVLCESCFSLRTESNPKLLGCDKTHQFVHVDRLGDEDEKMETLEEEVATQDNWLIGLLRPSS